MAADTQGATAAYDAFVCYNGDDEEDALRLADRLEGEHLVVFNAAREIRAGERFIPRLGAALKNARTTLVLFGKRGGQGWAELEIDLALSENRARGMPVIPVFLASATSDAAAPPLLSGFTYIDLRRDPEQSWDDLLASIRGAPAVSPGTAGEGATSRGGEARRARHDGGRRWRFPAKLAVAVGVGVVVLLAVFLGLASRRAGVQHAIGQQIDTMVRDGDWGAIEALASEGPIAVEPLDQHLLARYRGEATARAVKALLAIARPFPDEVCPRLAGLIALRGGRRDPVLSYEEVLLQIEGSPCAGRADMHDARAGAARLVGKALTGGDGFAGLQRQFATSPPFDCAALDRLRVPLGVSGPQACSGATALGAAAP